MKRPFLRSLTKKGDNPKAAEELGSPLRVIATVVVIFFVSQLAAAFVAELGLALAHPNIRTNINDSVAAQFVFILIAEALAAGSVFYILKKGRLGLAAIGLGRKPRKNDLWMAGKGFLAFYVVFIAVAVIITALWPSIQNEQQDVGFKTLNSGLDNILAFVSLVILPPLGEEILARGYLYSGLRRFWNFKTAMLATSLLFAVPHLFGGDSGLLWSAGADTFILSVVLVFLRERTGALYAGMLVHMTNNLIAYSIHIK